MLKSFILNIQIYSLLLLITALLSTCHPPLKTWFLTVEDISLEEKPASTRNTRKLLQVDYSHYVPDTNHLAHTPIRYIRVNVHFMNRSDSTQNFKEAQALPYAKAFLKAAEGNLKAWKKPWIPPNNDLPGLPKLYRYVLTPSTDAPNDKGIYCHYDDELFYFINKGANRNNYDRKVIEKYAIQKDSVLNIFIMPHHPDSVLSKTYKIHGTGIALSNNLKLAGIYESSNHKPWAFTGLLNHEVGHVLGLSHAWGYDGCDDTPIHTNCWNVSSTPPCDTMASNNVMDYNAHQSAWTPCQIGKVHRNFSKLNSRQRKILVRTWCTLKADKTIIIRDTITWKGARDLEGHIIIEPNAVLRINARLSLPKDAKITIRPTGKLILDDKAWIHNDCGDEWEGIEIQQEDRKKGSVQFIGAPRLENVHHFIQGDLNKLL